MADEMNLEEVVPRKEATNDDVILSSSDRDGLWSEYMEEEGEPNGNILKTISDVDGLCECKSENQNKRIKREFLNEYFPELVHKEVENDGCSSKSFSDKVHTKTEYIEKDAAKGKDSLDLHNNVEPNLNEVDFKSFYVQKDSQTPYSDATNSTHDSEKIKRPMNAFMIFSHYERKKVLETERQPKSLGKKWKELPKEYQAPYEQEAETLRRFHAVEYPGYRYQPRKKQNKSVPSFISMRNLFKSPKILINKPKKSSFKINNCFGSNSWVNSPVSSLSEFREEPLNLANLSLRVTIDSHFKERLRNPHHKVELSSVMKNSTSSEVSLESNLFSSLDSSSLYSAQSDQNSPDHPKYDIHSIIEEFMSEPSSSFFNPSLPLYKTPPFTPLDFNQLLIQDYQQQQQLNHQWYPKQRQSYQQQEVHQVFPRNIKLESDSLSKN